MITQVSLENFKCFESQVFDLAPLTVLSGLNGSGKSSFIQSLLLLKQSVDQKLLDSIGLSLNGDYVQLGAARDVLYEGASADYLLFKIRYDSILGNSWMFSYNSKSDVLERGYGDWWSGFPEHSFREENDGSVFPYHEEFQYLHAERLGPRTSFSLSEYQVNRRRSLGVRGEYSAHFLSEFGSTIKVHPALCRRVAKTDGLLQQVESWLGIISPGTRLHTTLYRDIDSVKLEFSYVSGKDSSSRYRSTNVGFGITYCLPVIVAILAARRGSLLIIENPEAHLHPQGQAMLGQLLAAASGVGVQIIVETHSDHILNGIRIGILQGRAVSENVRLFYFSRDVFSGVGPVHVRTISVDDFGRLSNRPEGFFDEFSKSMDQLMEPRSEYGFTFGF